MMAVGKPESKASTDEAQERLAVEAAQKDPARFVELYDNNFGRVYAFIARRVQNRDEAEDLTSEVFQKALANLPRFKWRGVPFAAWLFRIAANMIADRSKRAVKERDILDAGDPTDLTQISLEEIEFRAQIFRLVDTLPIDQRQVIALRFVQEKSIRAIADEMGRTEGAVKQLQFRGLQQLRAQLNEQPGEKNG
jgi:RNA polymerase sigma-70 factor (ECF subfamily)